MKKLIYALLASMLIFVGCASNRIGETRVPDWVLHEPVSTNEIVYAVGTAKATDADMAFRAAKADAQNNISKKLNITINDTVQTSITSNTATGSGSTFSENSSQVSESVLKNVLVKEYYERKDGNTWVVYILVEMRVTQ